MSDTRAIQPGACALWRRMDTPGHDAAVLRPSENGWSLRGRAVFQHQRGPAGVGYAVDLDHAWRTQRGYVRGFLAGQPFDHRISHEPDGWYLDGAPCSGLDHLVDLDFGFTPATNLQQLRRAALAIGDAADLPAVWFDIDLGGLVALPQHYERRSETTYWYTSPSASYQALLTLAPSGFVSEYPGLWVMEG